MACRATTAKFLFRFVKDHEAQNLPFPDFLTFYDRSPGGLHAIYAGTGYAIFEGAFFEQKMNFRVLFLVKSHGIINF